MVMASAVKLMPMHPIAVGSAVEVRSYRATASSIAPRMTKMMVSQKTI